MTTDETRRAAAKLLLELRQYADARLYMRGSWRPDPYGPLRPGAAVCLDKVRAFCREHLKREARQA